MKHFLKFFSLSLLFVFYFFAQNVSGQNLETSLKKSISLAKVEFLKPVLVKQSGHDLKLNIGIKNNGTAVDGIKYTLVLYKDSMKDATDTYVVPEVFNLSENESKTFAVPYSIPKVFSGTYSLGFEVRTLSGLRLASTKLNQKIILTDAKQGVLIDKKSCFLAVKGEKANAHYSPEEGIDIKNDEVLIASCVLVNQGPVALTLTPKFDVIAGSAVGNTVLSSSSEKISISSGEKKTVSFELPTPTEPQFYVTNVSLVAGDNQISNTVPFSFLIQGEGVVIKRVVFDKDSYLKKDTVNVGLFWDYVASYNREARLGTEMFPRNPKVTFTLASGDGKRCAKDAVFPLPLGEKFKQFTLSLATDCKDVKAYVLISDDEKKLASLFKGEYEYGTKIGENPIVSTENKSVVTSVLVLLLGILIIFGYVFKKYSHLLLLLLLIYGVFGLEKDVFADVDMLGEGNNQITVTSNRSPAADTAGGEYCTEENPTGSDDPAIRNQTIYIDVEVSKVSPSESDCTSIEYQEWTEPASDGQGAPSGVQSNSSSWKTISEGSTESVSLGRITPGTYTKYIQFRCVNSNATGSSWGSFLGDLFTDLGTIQKTVTIKDGCDLCPQIPGVQDTVTPPLYKGSGTACYYDYCPLLKGIQSSPNANCNPTPPPIPAPGTPFNLCTLFPTLPFCSGVLTPPNPPTPPPPVQPPPATDVCTLPPDDWPGNQTIPLIPPTYASSTVAGYCAIDVCTNIPGDQAEIPYFYVSEYDGGVGTACFLDMCENVDGYQESIPDGYNLESYGVCTPICQAPYVHPFYESETPGQCYVDYCSDIEGYQSAVPEGHHQEGTMCPVDVCVASVSNVSNTCPVGSRAIPGTSARTISCPGFIESTVPSTYDCVPNETTNVQPFGVFENATCDLLTGYAYDTDHPGQPLYVSVSENPTAIGFTPVFANKPRTLPSGNGNYGFSIPLTYKSIRNNQDHILYVLAQDPVTSLWYQLDNAKVVSSCSPESATLEVNPVPLANQCVATVNAVGQGVCTLSATGESNRDVELDEDGAVTDYRWTVSNVTSTKDFTLDCNTESNRTGTSTIKTAKCAPVKFNEF